MYRDDVCAVCGESLPPDHFYCRDHASTVDDRLHEIGALFAQVGPDLGKLARLLSEVAAETWDYLAEGEADDPLWPPRPVVEVRAEPEDITVDVDSEPGFVRARLEVPLAEVISALSRGLASAEVARFTRACVTAEGANATH